MLFRISLVLLFSFTTIAKLAAKSNVHTIVVQSPRALEDALELLQLDSGKRIHFEDAPYTLTTRTERSFSGALPIPKSHTFLFEYDPTQSISTNVVNLLDSYMNIDDSILFELIADPFKKDEIYVVPSKYSETEDDRTNVAIRSILDKKISVTTEQNSTFKDLVNVICNEASTQDLLLVPNGYLKHIAIGSHSLTNKSARYCLAYIINELNNADIAWSVRRGPPFSNRDLAVLHLSKFQQSTGSYDVFSKFETTRPLLSASEMLARLMSRTVIYEDIEYLCPCSILRDEQDTPQIPRGGIIDFNFHSTSNGVSVFNAYVQTYNTMNDAGDFETEVIGDALYIFPILALDKNSISRPQEPLLTLNTSLPVTKASFREIVLHLVDTIARNSQKEVSLVNMPEELSDIKVSIPSKKRRPISHILSDISKQTGRNLIWKLLYSPNNKSFTLDVEIIGDINPTRSWTLLGQRPF